MKYQLQTKVNLIQVIKSLNYKITKYVYSIQLNKSEKGKIGSQTIIILKESIKSFIFTQKQKEFLFKYLHF